MIIKYLTTEKYPQDRMSRDWYSVDGVEYALTDWGELLNEHGVPQVIEGDLIRVEHELRTYAESLA